MASYEIWMTNDTGARLGRVQPYWFQAVRVCNDVGACQLGVTPDFNPEWLARDNRIEFWRTPTDGRMGLFRTYFLREWRWDLIGEQETLRLYGRDPNDLLNRRIIAYEEDAKLGKVDGAHADDVQKLIVYDDMISDSSTPAYGSRDYANLTIADYLSAAPTITKTLSWRYVLDVLQEIAETSYIAGTRLYFDIIESDVSTATTTYQFRTYTDQPGRNLTNLGVMFSPQRGNLVNAFLDYDYTEEQNYIYAVGQGAKNAIELAEVYDAEAIAASAWNRREGYVNAVGEEDADGVEDRGNTELKRRAGRVSCGGDIRDTDQFRFGRDWHWGDVVRSRYRDVEFDALVRAVSLSMDQDKHETVTGSLEMVV